MIVGVLIWQDATLAHSSTSNKQNTASIDAPVGTMASAAIASQTGVTRSSKAIGDLTLKQVKESSLSTSWSVQSTESQVFAVQCHIVRHRKRNIFKRSAPVLED